MEFKKVPQRGRRPQSTSPLPSHSRSPQNTTVQSPSDRAHPIMSGRSLKSASHGKSQSHNPVRSFLFSKKGIALIAIILIIIVGLLLSSSSAKRNLSRQSAKDSQKVAESGNNPTTDEKATAPTYDTVTPNGKTIEELGGWQRVSPATSAPVFAYVDKIGDVSVNVSQQPLPDSFKNDVDNKVSELAKKFNATNTFTANSTKVYIGSSAKGPQSVIFTAKKLLILIKSQKTIDTKAWTNYINSLT